MVRRKGIGFKILLVIVLILALVLVLSVLLFTGQGDVLNTIGQSSKDTEQNLDETRTTLKEKIEEALREAAERGGILNGGTQSNNNANAATTAQTGAVKVAFVGDQGTKDSSREVLQLIKSEGADIVVHSGDYDYIDDPGAWKSMINEELGPNFPYVASIGNHDMKEWDSYKQILQERVNNVQGLECSGDIGTQSSCSYKGIFMVFSSKGMCEREYPKKDPIMSEAYPELCASGGSLTEYNHNSYIQQQLSSTNAVWKICSWHKNHNLFQTGDKPTTVPLSQYDACREGGAIIATGHEHAYARTHQMNNFANQDFTEQTPIQIGGGSTFAFVSAISGWSVYPSEDERLSDPWWAVTQTRKDDPAYGAFFCTFNPDGTGNCYFKNVDGDTVDQFNIQSAQASSSTR